MRQELRALAKDTADLVARHLVAVGRLIDEDAQTALAHARAAGALAGRIAAVREALGLAAYAAQEWADALAELRTARRISGRADHLAVLADCERALGRPERALTLLEDPDVSKLAQATRVELVIVVAGARRDLGQRDAAVLLLQGPARATTVRRPWAARLWYAYADALLAAGREQEAREWFAKAAEHDGQGETDAMDRLLELDGLVIDDLLDGDDEQPQVGEQRPEEPLDLQALLSVPVESRAVHGSADVPSVEDAAAGRDGAGLAADGSAAEVPAAEVPAADRAAATVPASEGSAGESSAPGGAAADEPAAAASPAAAAESEAEVEPGGDAVAPLEQEPEQEPEPAPAELVGERPARPSASAPTGPLFSDGGTRAEGALASPLFSDGEAPAGPPPASGPSVPAVTFATPPRKEEPEP